MNPSCGNLTLGLWRVTEVPPSSTWNDSTWGLDQEKAIGPGTEFRFEVILNQGGESVDPRQPEL